MRSRALSLSLLAGDARREPADDALVSAERQALAGVRAAWELLIRRHDRAVRVALLARGFPVETAREMTQDAWARLIEQSRRGALHELVLPALAIRQALFLALDDRRRRAGPVEDLESVRTTPSPGASAEERLVHKEQLDRALDVLRGCSPSAQRVFLLAYQSGGMSHGEIAARVGLSLQRVRQTLCEVRSRLRRELGHA
ncbi:MAG TPA: sigma-70 family RNA polymerase sigma factor [Myxococcaceae bacterium]|jgi:RNA polymerase sigma-70 factor (ECF subfamily)|nr:sigma-70 family RNA polymerase sigma factor [Myxococcaceae bacterium]